MTEVKFKYHDSFGIKRTMIADDEDDSVFHVDTELELDGILESVERDRELQVAGSANKTVARVPMTIVEQAFHEQWDENQWKRWLNDPQNEPFRIWKGRV